MISLTLLFIVFRIPGRNKSCELDLLLTHLQDFEYVVPHLEFLVEINLVN